MTSPAVFAVPPSTDAVLLSRKVAVLPEPALVELTPPP